MSQNKLFEEFKALIKPFMVNVKQIAINQLRFFQLFQTKHVLQMNDNVIANYELFMHLHQQNNGKNIIPSLEVELMWIVHALNPRKYYNNITKAFDKLVPVQLLNKDNNSVYHSNLNHFRHYMQQNVDEMLFKKVTSNIDSSPFITKLDIKQAIGRQFKFIDKINLIQSSINITEKKK
eukprot:391113_1